MDSQPTQLANPYLSRKQQDLLLAALNSQASGTSDPASFNPAFTSSKRAASPDPSSMDAANDLPLFASPQHVELDGFNADYSPDLDYLDGDNSYDFENADLGGDMIGGLPGGSDQHEKRKNPDAGNESEEGDAKRQETQDGEKGAKKPGRKPLTSEPTTKRKAQNRAAQRAFRERKEKHLKDLETKVSDLTKAQEADKHENSLLKAQVDRLKMELGEYRKRLSLHNSGVSRSPPLSASGTQQRSSSGSARVGNFSFDFPKFGALPGSQIFGTASPSPVSNQQSTATVSNGPSPGATGSSMVSVSRENSGVGSMSPQSLHGLASKTNSPAQPFAAYSTDNNMHGFASTLPQMSASEDPFGDLFSPSILKTATTEGYFPDSHPTSTRADVSQSHTAQTGGESTAGISRVFQFNSGSSAADSTSPSASSSSQWNHNGTGNSSCETSPEPSHDSPALKDKADTSNVIAGQGTNPASNSSFGFGSASYSMTSGGAFDPVLFGDYRESHDAIVGAGDFNNGFFDDALNSVPFDYGSPSNLFGILASPTQPQATIPSAANGSTPSHNLMAEVSKARDGGDDDYGLPFSQLKKADSTGKMISCNNIWNQLQSNPDFQDGKFDLDSLCSELRTKARCSESGVLVDQDHVDAALRKLGTKSDQGRAPDGPQLLFEEASWENVLNRMSNGRRA